MSKRLYWMFGEHTDNWPPPRPSRAILWWIGGAVVLIAGGCAHIAGII